MNRQDRVKTIMIASGIITSALAFLAMVGCPAASGLLCAIPIIGCNIAYYYLMNQYYKEEE